MKTILITGGSGFLGRRGCCEGSRCLMEEKERNVNSAPFLLTDTGSVAILKEK